MTNADACTQPDPAPTADAPAAARETGGRWKRGSSPNPGGKTKAERNLFREVRELAGQNAPAAIKKLRRIMDNPRAPYVAQIAAASAILDRAVGKPSVPAASTRDDGTPAPMPIDPEDLSDFDFARRIAFTLAKGLRIQQGLPPPRSGYIEASPASEEEPSGD